MRQAFNIRDEFSKLKEVIIGTAANFIQGEKINRGMRRYYGKKYGPTRQKLTAEYLYLKKILEAQDVKVYSPNPSKDISQQLAPRDIGFVVDSTFVICNMKFDSRKHEIDAIRHILNRFTGKIIKTPDDVNLEGGNVLVDGKTIFLGIGIRTSPNAVDFMKKKFGKKFRIMPLYLDQKEETIHLDGVFNMIGDKVALVYPREIKKLPGILSTYKLLKVTHEEKLLGACNVMVVDNQTVIIRNKLPRIKKILTKSGFKVLITPWDESGKTGTTGPRCACLPLIRS